MPDSPQDLDLDAIEQRAAAVYNTDVDSTCPAAVLAGHDVPALLAEVRRLREECGLRDAGLAETGVQIADMHRQIGELHAVTARAMTARIEAQRREEAARQNGSGPTARRWHDAALAVRARYPADVFPPESGSDDAIRGTFARLICDEIARLATSTAGAPAEEAHGA